jgi:hypothetical protein
VTGARLIDKGWSLPPSLSLSLAGAPSPFTFGGGGLSAPVTFGAGPAAPSATAFAAAPQALSFNLPSSINPFASGAGLSVAVMPGMAAAGADEVEPPPSPTKVERSGDEEILHEGKAKMFVKTGAEWKDMGLGVLTLRKVSAVALPPPWRVVRDTVGTPPAAMRRGRYGPTHAGMRNGAAGGSHDGACVTVAVWWTWWGLIRVVETPLPSNSPHDHMTLRVHPQHAATPRSAGPRSP